MEEKNPYDEIVNIGGMTRQEADDKWAAQKQGAETTETTETTQVETTTDTGANTEAATTETETTSAPDPFYKSLGFESEDLVIAEINEARSFRERMASIQAKEAALAEKETLISKFENPYNNDVVAKLDKAVEKTGISDLNVLVKLVNTTAESVANDPITAIVAAKVIDNPSILSGGITFDNLIAIEKNKLEKSGVDFDDKTSVEYMSLLVDSNAALTKINNFQQDLGNVQGKFNFAKENSQKALEKYNQEVATLTPKVEELLKSDKRSFEVEGVKFDIALSKESRDKIKDNATKHAANLGLDLNTVEGVKVLNDLVGAYAKGAMVSSGEFEKALFKAVDAKVRAEVLDEVSQGRPDKRSNPAGAPNAKGKTESQLLFEKLENEAAGRI